MQCQSCGGVCLTLMPEVAGFLAAFQLAPLSIVTSSTSEVLRVLRIPHMYWSTSKPSNCAGLLELEQKQTIRT